MTKNQAYKSVCDDIQMIMETYRAQEAEGSVDTPGGLEHMGDVWKQMHEWDEQITSARDSDTVLLKAEMAEVISIENDMRHQRDALSSIISGMLFSLKEIAALEAGNLSIGDQVFVVTSARAAIAKAEAEGRAP